MPIYEFQCGACDHRFDALAARREDPAPPCPRCGAADVQRRISAFAVLGSSAPPAPGPCGSQDCACRRTS